MTALRIAIVDDELDFLMKLRDMINKYCPDSDKLNIYEFGSGEKLLYNFKRNMYDVIILDVEMEGLNGLETATKIRSYDNLVIIVFLTSHQEFALQGYEVKAFRYMLKSQPEPMYQRQLQSVFNEYHQTHLTFPIQLKNNIRNILINDIIYFEVFKRTIVIHTAIGEFEFYGKLKEIESDERLINFVKPHKSYYVNLSYIDNISKNALIMKSNDIIPLSRNLKQIVTERFLSFLTEGC